MITLALLPLALLLAAATAGVLWLNLTAMALAAAFIRAVESQHPLLRADGPRCD